MGRRGLWGGLGKRSARLVLGVSAAVVALAALLGALTIAVAAGSGTEHAKLAASRAATRSPTAGQNAGVLGAAITPDPALVHDGDGVASIALADVNSGTVLVRRVRARILVPPPARVAAVGGASGWRCRLAPGSHSVSCELVAAAISSDSLRPVNLRVGAVGRMGSPSYGRANLQVRASWIQPGLDGRLHARSSTAGLVVGERAPLAVAARAVQRTVIDPVKGIPATTAILQGTVGRRTPEPIRFEWRQVCGHGACSRVQWTSATGGLLVDGQQPEAGFTPPQVNRPELLRFALTASDPRGSVSATATVRVLPDRIANINPGLASVTRAIAGLRTRQRPVTAIRLTKADQAVVNVGAPGLYHTRPGGLVRLDARVQGQQVSRTSWRVSVGPRSMLAGAKRSRAAITFRAPTAPGSYALRMTATTAAGRFTRDEIIQVAPALRLSADVASVGPEQERAFCAVVNEAARQHGEIRISLPSGGTFSAKATTGDTCPGTQEIKITGGSTSLGGFELKDVQGTLTREHGLVITSGTLASPKFWGAPTHGATDANVHVVHGPDARAAQVGAGLEIPFNVPTGGDVGVALEIPLTSGGFGDLEGGVKIKSSAFSKFPLTSSLPETRTPKEIEQGKPDGWKLDSIALTVVPAARRFELTADAKGPALTGGELSFQGVLTFDGQMSLSVVASNLAVFDSAGGQNATLTAQGTLTLLPGQSLDANGNSTGSYFPVIDVEVSAALKNYRPVSNVSLSGQVAWSTHGPLEFAGTLDTTVKGPDASAKGHDIRMTLEGEFTNADDWRLFAQFASTGDQGFPIGDPSTPLLRLKELTGELKRTAGTLDFSVKGAATDIHLIKDVPVKSAEVQFTTACVFRNDTTPQSRVCLLVNADVELKTPDNKVLAVTGGIKLDLKTLDYEVNGGVTGKFGPEQFHLEHVEIFVTNVKPSASACTTVAARPATDNGLYFEFTAQGTVLGKHVHVTGQYLAGGGGHLCLAASLGTAELPSGNSDQLAAAPQPAASGCGEPDAPTLQNLRFQYSNDTSTTGTGEFKASFCLPAGIRQELGAVGTTEGTVTFWLSDLGFDGRATVALPKDHTVWFLNAKNRDTPDPTKAALGFKSLTLRVWATRAEGAGVSLDAKGEVSLPAPTAKTGGAGTASKVGLTLKIAAVLRPAPQLTFETTLGESGGATGTSPPPPCAGNRVQIENAFGATGLNICQFGLSGSIGAGGLGLGVSAEFTPPTEWGKELGIGNASFRIGVKLSATDPCVDLTVQQADPDKGPALNLLNKDAIIANLAILRIAPNGCELPGNVIVPAGIRLAFDGTMFGTKTKVNLEIARKDPGLRIDFTQRTDASSLGPLKFGATNIRVLLDAPRTELEIHTSMRIGDHGGLKIDGAFTRDGSSTTLAASACLLGNLPPVPEPGAAAGEAPPCGEVNVLGARFNGNVKLDFKSGPSGIDAKFSGRLKADLRVFDLDVDLRSLTYDSTKQDHPGLQELDFRTQATVKLGPASATGGVEVVYARSPEVFKLSLNGSWSLWGFSRGSIERTWDLSRIELPFTIVAPGVPLKLAFGVIRLSGDAKGALVWTPSGGFSVQTDFKAFRLELCDPFDVLGCTKIAELHADKDTGEVRGEILGIKYGVPAKEWIGGANKAELPPISTAGLIVNGRWRVCVDRKPGTDLRLGASVLLVDCPAGSKNETVSQPALRLVQRWTLDPTGQIHDFGSLGCLTANGTYVTMFRCGAGGTRLWHIDYYGRLVDADGKCMDIEGDSAATFTARLGGCANHLNHATPNQSWAMSGVLRLPHTDLCAGGRGGQTTAFTPLVLVRCEPSPTNQTLFKTNPDGKLHVTDTDCITKQAGDNRVLGLTKNDAIIHACTFSILDGTPNFEIKNGEVKQAGRDECLVATNLVLGARVEFASCGTEPKRRQWDFGR